MEFLKTDGSRCRPSNKKAHEFHLYIIKELHDAGVNTVCGTDAGIGVTVPGFSIHGELQLYKEAGLSNHQALETATVNAQKVHQIMNKMGTIEIGKIANMILVKDYPLEDLSGLQRPDELLIIGRRLSSHLLDNIRERAINRRNFILTAVRYGENQIVEKLNTRRDFPVCWVDPFRACIVVFTSANYSQYLLSYKTQNVFRKIHH